MQTPNFPSPLPASDADAPAEQADGGRWRPHASQGRVHRLTPRFSAEELEEVKQAAASIGMTATGFCADSALAAARGVPLALATEQEREALARLLRELFAARTAVVRFGTNVNQAVAALNSTGQAPDSLDRAVVLCTRSVQALDEVTAEVARRLRG
jgi:uncharacterized protein (DUF1778 family)